jgi:Tfp pilus assembly protein PilV
MFSTTVLSLVLLVTWIRGETQYRRLKRKATAAARAQASQRWTDWLEKTNSNQDFEETYAEYQRRRRR